MEITTAFTTMKIVDFIEKYLHIQKSDIFSVIDKLAVLSQYSITKLAIEWGFEDIFRTVYSEFLTYAFMPLEEIFKRLNKCYQPPTTPPPTVDIFANVDRDVVRILKSIFDDKDPIYIANVASDPKVK